MNELINSLPWYKKLLILRMAKGWSQEEAAQECCTSVKNYWNWERGINMPRKLSKRAIAAAFQVPLKEIFD